MNLVAIHFFTFLILLMSCYPFLVFHGLLDAKVITSLFTLMIVYDVTRRETFTNLSDVWSKELELYSTNPDCVKMLVGNKVDRVRDTKYI